MIEIEPTELERRANALFLEGRMRVWQIGQDDAFTKKGTYVRLRSDDWKKIAYGNSVWGGDLLFRKDVVALHVWLRENRSMNVCAVNWLWCQKFAGDPEDDTVVSVGTFFPGRVGEPELALVAEAIKASALVEDFIVEDAIKDLAANITGSTGALEERGAA